MSTQVMVRKLNREVGNLRRDFSVLQEILLASVRDAEGEYRAAFIKKMLRRAKEEPRYCFTNARAFLKHIHAASGF